VALSINDVRNGMTILVNNDVYLVIETQHVKPGKGAAFLRVKLRDMKTGNVQDMTFRGEEKIEPAFVEERKLQYQYSSGHMFHFMDQENYEEVAISEENIGESKKLLKDNLDVSGLFYKNEPLSISLPNFVEYKIAHTEPGIKGDTAKGGTKPAEIETGAIIQVPLFINEGDAIKVDTRTGTYIERVYR
jgi:elongation factor P